MADPATSVPLTVASTWAIDGDTESEIAMTPGPDEPEATRSDSGRTATRSVTGLSAVSSDRRPSAATAPSDRADPMSAATIATAHVFALAPDGVADATGAASSPRAIAPNSDGWRQRRSSGGNGR